jgi:tetratricopeptide (TPR) repeat protein
VPVIKEETRNLSINQALDLGVELGLAGNFKAAVTMFRGVLVHDPDNFEAMERLGSALFEGRQYYEALYWFWRGLKMEHRDPMALTNYGLCVSQLGHWEEGLTFLARAAHIADKRLREGKPISNEAMALIWNNLGNCLERLKRYPEALEALDKGLSFKADDPFPLYNRGIVLLRLNRQEEGVASLDKAVALKPNDYDAIYNRGMGHLLLGRLEQGFADYEARLLTTENKCPNLGLPVEKKWNGEDIAGKTLLCHAEQGLGDTIQSLRFIPQLQALGARVVLVVHKELTSLARAMPDVEILEPGSSLEGQYDRWVALMSLPYYLGIKDEKDLLPVWEPSGHPLVKWEDDLGLPKDKLNIAICWAGNFQHKNDVHRSIPLLNFATLFEVPHCNFISVQQMRPGEVETFANLKKGYPNLQALWLEDMADTAAVLDCVDMCISVDTAVLHLAGTLGVPTIGLIPKHGTDWRWQVKRTDSPWYPSMTLYRQDVVGDWRPTLRRVRAHLEGLVRTMHAIEGAVA